VRKALDTLSSEQRHVIELAFFSGLSQSEIALKLNEPLGTIKTRIRNGMLKLRELLRPHQGRMAVKEHESGEARTEAAMNLSLGLLESTERARLNEHLRSGCVECKAEVLSFAQVAGALAISTNVFEPPRRLRGQLLQTVAGLSASRDDHGTQAWEVVRASALPWQPAKRKGIWEKSLLYDPVRHRSTRIIKMDPGAEILAHRHLGDEETLVLEGKGELGNSSFEPGERSTNFQRRHWNPVALSSS